MYACKPAVSLYMTFLIRSVQRLLYIQYVGITKITLATFSSDFKISSSNPNVLFSDLKLSAFISLPHP